MNAGRKGAPKHTATRPKKEGRAAKRKPRRARPRRAKLIAPGETPAGDDTTGADGRSGRRPAGTESFGSAVANHGMSEPETSGAAIASPAAKAPGASPLNNVSMSPGMRPIAVGPSLSVCTLTTGGVATTGIGVTVPPGEEAGMPVPPEVPGAGTLPEAVPTAGLPTASTIGAVASTTGCTTSSTGCATSTTGSTTSITGATTSTTGAEAASSAPVTGAATSPGTTSPTEPTTETSRSLRQQQAQRPEHTRRRQTPSTACTNQNSSPHYSPQPPLRTNHSGGSFRDFTTRARHSKPHSPCSWVYLPRDGDLSHFRRICRRTDRAGHSPPPGFPVASPHRVSGSPPSAPMIPDSRYPPNTDK